MSAGAPLAGKTIVVTRPRAQALPLAEAIGAAGGKPLFFPLLEISPAADPQPLRQAISCLADYTFAVFISPNAVDYAVPAILARGSWPESLTPAAVGPGTVKALAAFGIFGCIAPVERFDSEGLLALPKWHQSAVGALPFSVVMAVASCWPKPCASGAPWSIALPAIGAPGHLMVSPP
jgi:uroporphyrinogen-III synthase